MTDDRRQTTDRRPRFLIRNSQFAIRNLAWWACAALVAIAVLESNALWGLAVACTGGIILGVWLFVK